MRTYRKRFKVSESFPVERGQTWTIKEGNRVAEKWLVVEARRDTFIAEITEFFPKNGAPRPRT